ncbi:site-specific DNA-methyltransferase [Xenorhabdus bovienii]|uniref:DNA-methyltransferase n=1 Tax=Xenorhabdus bovienii TaxID=40576 RepID=UPI0023B188B2|nr:site-specific DNA-methyltransferase [Xenorhabdus bovienii]MDE9477049.1 site-specific DNA-methyltransferase [Xenorhabdus bovienii]MDE9517846.1 site-specific DNA-methyltransferase [Xenorhabdus bovienii]MDE9530029.1 site-specific DNA-methyltransferase [Xenorhabdus bovienii]
MKNTVNFDSITLFNDDSLQFIKTLPDNCIDLIATDPPYFRVKSCSWDNQWEDVTAYLAWLDEMLAEFWRVLKPNGSLYMFCGSRLASDTEILVRERFNVLNHIIWAKPSGPWRRQNKESLRTYFPATERIIFAEHYQGPYHPKTDGYSRQCRELKQNVFKPLIDYFRNARKSLGITEKQIHQATGKQMSSHWFGYSQWQLPNAEDYQKLQVLFSSVAEEKRQNGELNKPHDELATSYLKLSRRYEELSQEYGLLRRPFSVTADVPYTDVWNYSPVQYYPGKHPCEKPAELMEHIIRSSSREGDIVADFFMGSGATLKSALNLNRRVLGVELEEERFLQTKTEISEITMITDPGQPT